MKYTFGKYIDERHIEIMRYCKDTYQYSCFTGDGSDERWYGKNGLPVAELYDGIAGIEQVVGDKDNIIGGICLCFVMVKQLQDKHPSVPMKQPPYPVNNIHGNNRVNDIGKDIIVHDRFVLGMF